MKPRLEEAENLTESRPSHEGRELKLETKC